MDKQGEFNIFEPQYGEELNRLLFGDFWIDYPLADRGLAQLQELYHYPDTVRTPGMIICGETNSGKTMLVREFKREVDGQFRSQSDTAASSPILLVEMPPDRPTPKSLFCAILREIGVPFSVGATSDRLQHQISKVLPENGIRMIVIDELHNISVSTPNQQLSILNTLRYLSNDLNIKVVAVGTKEAHRLVQSDQQLGSRLSSFYLQPWRSDDTDYARFIIQLIIASEYEPPEENDIDELVTLVHYLTEGITGETKDLILAAARRAKGTGKKGIDSKLIKELNWQRPCDRYGVV